MAKLLNPTSNEQKYHKLTSAVVVGATTSNSTRIWVRVYKAGEWYLVLSEARLSGDLVRLEEKAVPDFFQGIGIQPAYCKSRTFTQDNNGLTGVFEVDGLKPDTCYYYALISADTNETSVPRRTEIGGDRPYHFRTPVESPGELAFGFYSCHDHISANGDIGAWPLFYETLKDARAAFVVGGGDQVYVDTNKGKDFLDIWEWLKDNKEALADKYRDATGSVDKKGITQYLLDIYRWYYRVYWSVPALRTVFERFPQYMMWDDHEIMDGWGSLTKKERLNKISRLFEDKDTKLNQLLIDCMWQAACRAYYEYQHSHNPVTPYDHANPDVCQWDYVFRHGDTAFYALDMRGHHDVEKKDDKYKILGEEQFGRFAAWLSSEETSRAKALFVVSSVPVIHWADPLVNYADLGESKDDFMDEWGHETNHWERNQLLDAIFKRLGKTGQTVVFLSGDVHCASVFRLRHKKFPAAKVFQVTSSAISRKPAPKASLLGVSPGGKMDGSDAVFSERLYALVGSKNFAVLRVMPSSSPQEKRIVLELHWPAGEEDEVSKKRIALT